MTSEFAKPKPSYAPIYAAALYPELAVLFRKHGYALAVHGSLARDMDLIAVPWVEVPSVPSIVIDEVVDCFDVRLIGSGTPKLHGRVAWTISIGHGCCAIDLSFFPFKE